MSPDPYVQFPESTQGFNRYTYVNNNPLSYVDPSGYFLKKIGKWVKRVVKNVGQWGARLGKMLKPYVATIVSAVVAVLAPPLAPLAATLGAGIQTAINGGTLDQVFISAAIALASYHVMGAVHEKFASILEQNGGCFGTSRSTFNWNRFDGKAKDSGENQGEASRKESQGGATAPTSSGPGFFDSAADYLGRFFVGEALEIAGGVVGTPYGILKGLYGIGKGIVTGNLGAIGHGFTNLGAAVTMFRSGSASGLLHPGRGAALTPDTGTKLNNASLWHDGQRNLATSSAAQFGWIQRAWAGPGTELGPWGQVYRLYGTVGFGIIGAGQAALGY